MDATVRCRHSGTLLSAVASSAAVGLAPATPHRRADRPAGPPARRKPTTRHEDRPP